MATGTFMLNGISNTGAVIGTLNDGRLSTCAGDGNIQVLRLDGIDFTNPGNGHQTRINCMTDFGSATSMMWPPDSPGQCAMGGANNCSWKSHGITSVNGNLYLFVYRQQQGTAWARDSTLIMSPDGGVTWYNKAHIGGIGSVNGDAPSSPGGATYPAGMLWKDAAPWDGASQKFGFLSFAHFCQDESISCPSKDGNTTYTYAYIETGDYGSYRLLRWPKTSMPTLDISTIQYYSCATLPTITCDGNANANWTSNLAAATIIPSIFGAMVEVIYLKDQDLYVGAGWNGGNGDYYLQHAPHPWGPFTLDLTAHPRGESNYGINVFTNFPLAAVRSTGSSTASLILASTTSSAMYPSSSVYFDRYTLSVTGSGVKPIRLRGKVRGDPAAR